MHSLLINIFGINLKGISISGWEGNWIQNSRISLITILLFYKYGTYDYRVIFFMSKCVYILFGPLCIYIYIYIYMRFMQCCGEQCVIKLCSMVKTKTSLQFFIHYARLYTYKYTHTHTHTNHTHTQTHTHKHTNTHKYTQTHTHTNTHTHTHTHYKIYTQEIAHTQTHTIRYTQRK